MRTNNLNFFFLNCKMLFCVVYSFMHVYEKPCFDVQNNFYTLIKSFSYNIIMYIKQQNKTCRLKKVYSVQVNSALHNK